MREARAEALRDLAPRLYADHQVTAPYRPDAEQSGARALANAALGDDHAARRRRAGAHAVRQRRTNMTQQLAAFSCLLQAGTGDEATRAFYDQWRHDRLVIDKWFMLQIVNARPETAADIAPRS